MKLGSRREACLEQRWFGKVLVWGKTWRHNAPRFWTGALRKSYTADNGGEPAPRASVQTRSRLRTPPPTASPEDGTEKPEGKDKTLRRGPRAHGAPRPRVYVRGWPRLGEPTVKPGVHTPASPPAQDHARARAPRGLRRAKPGPGPPRRAPGLRPLLPCEEGGAVGSFCAFGQRNLRRGL